MSDECALFFEVPLDNGIRPVSLNNAYPMVTDRRGYNHRALSSEGQAWKDLVALHTRLAWQTASEQTRMKIGAQPWLALRLDYRLGEQRLPDASNLIKLAEDATMGAIGRDDRCVADIRCTRLRARKHRKQWLELPCLRVTIKPFEGDLCDA